MKVTQEKPKVIGYQQTSYNGVRWRKSLWSSIMSADSMFVESERDAAETGVKSKFRPVYEVKNEN